MKYKLSIFLFMVLCVFFYSCKKICGEIPSSKVAGFSIDFFSVASNNYLYPDIRPIPGYNKDSLVIVDDIGRNFKLRPSLNQDPNEPLKRYYRFSLGPVYYNPTDQNSFTQEITRKFYIRYNSNEIDTLTCIFKNQKTKCSEEFESIRFYYRGELIHQNNNNFDAGTVKLNKP